MVEWKSEGGKEEEEEGGWEDEEDEAALEERERAKGRAVEVEANDEEEAADAEVVKILRRDMLKARRCWPFRGRKLSFPVCRSALSIRQSPFRLLSSSPFPQTAIHSNPPPYPASHPL